MLPAGLARAQHVEDRALDGAGVGVEPCVAAAVEQLGRGRGQDLGARVAHLVDAVAEAHQPLAGVERLVRPVACLVGQGPTRPRGALADAEHHLERRARARRRAAVP